MKTNKYLETDAGVYPEVWTRSTVSGNLFNSAICASAIVAATEINLFQSIRKNGSIDVVEFCIENSVQEYPFRVLVKALCSFEILSGTGNRVVPDKNFEEVFATKGYFTWLIKGYAHTMENMDALLKADSLKISNVKRNGTFIAKSGKDYGDKFVNAHFTQLFEKLNPKVVADLGCGSADRLIRIIKTYEHVKGIGLDINPGAVTVARENIRTADMEDKIQVVCSDISSMEPTEIFRDVEMVFSFFMGHDLWPKENCKNIFKHIKEVFPNATNFLLCDTYRSQDVNEFPIFTLGFELTHAFMGQVIPTYADWLQLFDELNWTVVETLDIGIPFSTIFNIKIR